MRLVNSRWGALNASRTRERRFFIKLHLDPDAPQYFLQGALHGWTASGATLTSQADYAELESSGSTPQLLSPSDLDVPGFRRTVVQARIRRTAGTGWTGNVLYQTDGGHGFSSSFRKHVDDPTVTGEWVIVTWNMSELTAGGDDWITSVITEVRLDLGAGSDDDFDIEWIAIGTPHIYVVSHGDIAVHTPGEVLGARLSRTAVVSQGLNLDEGRSTIGSFRFDAVDVGGALTTAQREALLNREIGLRGKRCEFWSGFRILDLTDYELKGTQTVSGLRYDRAQYTIETRDIQRSIRDQIFEPVEIKLIQTALVDDTTLEIAPQTTLFAHEHGPSYSDGTDGQSVAYVRFEDEIIRVPAAGISATQLTDCVRGALGTRAVEHAVDEDSAEGVKGEEVIYLELPVPKLVYALLTGILLDQGGAVLPPHWHLGIDPSLVRLPDFMDFGEDFYVHGDDTQGVIERYVLDSGEDGKRFIEQQILRKYGMFMPVGIDGTLGLRRAASLLDGASVDGVISEGQLTRAPSIRYAYDRILNDIMIHWNEFQGSFTRKLRVRDPDSIQRWEAAPEKTIEAKGWVGNRHTDSLIREYLQGLRDMYANPPLEIPASVLGSQCLFEPGDIVRIRTSTARDVTNELSDKLDRAARITDVRLDLERGEHRYTLEAATIRPSAAVPLDSNLAVPDAYYTSEGTDIASLPGVSDAGAELVLPDGLHLSGHENNTNAAAIYYATKDVRIPAGDTVTWDQNVQLRIRGVLVIEGDIDGSAAGLAGTTDTVSTTPLLPFNDTPVLFQTQPGVPGYFGSTQAHGALVERVQLRSGSTSKYRVRLQSVPATITQGIVQAIPSYLVHWNDDLGRITGFPTDLRGSSGGPGGLRWWRNRELDPVVTRGADGGTGGAGLLIIARGMTMGVAGRIITSGGPGEPPVLEPDDLDFSNTLVAQSNVHGAWSGGGAGGAPGATMILLDGATSTSPVLHGGNVIADYGETPMPAGLFNQLTEAWIVHNETRFDHESVNQAMVPRMRLGYFESSMSGHQAGLAAARLFFVLPTQEPVGDQDRVELAGIQQISLDITEAFSQRDDTKLTTLLIEITEVSTTGAYSHASIYTRRITGDDQEPEWVRRGGASPRLRVDLPADGELYLVRAVPTLVDGTEAEDGEETGWLVSEPGLGFEPGADVTGNHPQSVDWLTDASLYAKARSNNAGNLVVNPSFEDGLDPHDIQSSAGGIWSTQESANARSGDRVLQYNTSGQSGNARLDLNGPFGTRTRHIAAQEGDEFLISLWARLASGTANNVRIRAAWREADGTGLGTAGPSSITPVSAWSQNIGSSGPAPAGTAYLQLWVNVLDNGNTGVVQIDDIFCIQKRDVLQEINGIPQPDALSADNFNAFMTSMRLNESGQMAPAGWYTSTTDTSSRLRYQDDAARTELLNPTGTGSSNNAAKRVNPGTKYEFAALVRRVSGSGTMSIAADEYDSELPSGKAYVSFASSGEHGLSQERTRSVTVASETVGTSYAIISGTYTPTSTAKWFSPLIRGGGNPHRCLWFVVQAKEVDTGAITEDAITEGFYDTDTGPVNITITNPSGGTEDFIELTIPPLPFAYVSTNTLRCEGWTNNPGIPAVLAGQSGASGEIPGRQLSTTSAPGEMVVINWQRAIPANTASVVRGMVIGQQNDEFTIRNISLSIQVAKR